MRIAPLAILVLGLTGCPFGGVNQINRIPEVQPLSEPALVNRPGKLVHEPTGFEFAELYDNFQRVTAYNYDTQGLDFSVGYNDRRATCLIVATIYVYPAPRMTFIGAAPSVVTSLQRQWLEAEFERSRAEVESAHSTYEVSSLGVSVFPVSDDLVQGPWVSFAGDDQLSDLRLFLYRRQWFLKYRFSYPETCEGEAHDRLAAFVHQLPWSAAQQGAAADAQQRVSIGVW